MSCQTCCKPKTSYNQTLCDLRARLKELEIEKRLAKKHFRQRSKSECDEKFQKLTPADYQDKCADINNEKTEILDQIRTLQRNQVASARKNLRDGERTCAKHVNAYQKTCC